MTYQERLKWFHEARFGIYIHFGLYSLLGRGEWTMYSERIAPKDYEGLADRFDPSPDAAMEWCTLAKQAGEIYAAAVEGGLDLSQFGVDQSLIDKVKEKMPGVVDDLFNWFGSAFGE